MRWAVWAAVLAGVAGGARVAHSAELAAEGPRECADTGEISFRVERSIGMPLSQAAPLRFDVVMELAETGRVEEQTGVVDPAAPPRRTAEAWVPSLSLWLVGDAGSLPDPGIGAALGAEIEWRKFQLRAVGTLLFERQTRMAATATAGAPGAKLELFTGGVLGCTAPFASLRAPLAPLLCLGAELGRIAGWPSRAARAGRRPMPRRASAPTSPRAVFQKLARARTPRSAA